MEPLIVTLAILATVAAVIRLIPATDGHQTTVKGLR